MLNDVLVIHALITVNVKLIFNVLLVVIDFNDALDFEHINQQVLEELDLDLLLNDDERSVLQLNDSLVDLTNH